MTTSPNRFRRWLVTGAIAGGALLGASGIAAAAGGSPSTAPTESSDSSDSSDATDPAPADRGPGETLLSGETAEKVKAAALAAVPGGTVIRMETDSGAAEYEAHMTKADGTRVTVLLDGNFEVTAIEEGRAGCPKRDGATAPEAEATSV